MFSAKLPPSPRHRSANEDGPGGDGFATVADLGGLLVHRCVVLSGHFHTCLLVHDGRRQSRYLPGIADRPGPIIPLAGPAIDHRMHYGPIWFYVLALPLWLTGSWMAVSLWVGALASSVYPLAYRLGNRLSGRCLGLTLAALLALPSWASVYYLVYSHTALITAAMVLVALVLSAWLQKPGLGRALMLGIALGMAFHTQVVTAGLGLPVAVVIGWRLRSDLPSLSMALATVGVGFTLPLMPYLYQQAGTGWNELASGPGYFASLDLAANIAAVPTALVGTAFGVQYALTHIADWPGAAVVIANACIAALLVYGLICLLRSGERVSGRLLQVCLIAVVGLLNSCLLIRNFAPFYQVIALWPALILLPALGLAAQQAPRLTACVMGLSLLLLGAQWLGMYQKARAGVFELDGGPLADIRQWDRRQWVTRWILPAKNRDQVGQWLCGRSPNDPVLLLGHLAGVLETSTALEAAIHCGRLPQLYLVNQGQSASAGVHREMARAIGLPPVELSFGPLQLVDPARVIDTPSAVLSLSRSVTYPVPSPVSDIADSELTYQIQLGNDEVLIASNPLNDWFGWQSAILSEDERVVEPIYRDGGSVAWRCQDCRSPLTLVIRMRKPEWAQIFVLALD